MGIDIREIKKIRTGEIFAVLMGAIISPLYLLLINNPALIPDALLFIKPSVSGALHLFIQLIFCELIFLTVMGVYKNTAEQNRTFFALISWFFLIFFIIKSGWIINEAAIVTALSFIVGSCVKGIKIKISLIRVVLLFLVQIAQIIIFW